METASGTKRRGPRPAGSDTRESILDAARDQFAAYGYGRTTIRSVASAAGVDPRLVQHYFGTKQELFAEAVQLPVDADELLASLFGRADATSIAEAVARALLGILEDPETRQPLLAVVRAAASEAEAAEIIRLVITGRVLTPLTARIGADHPDLRASLIGAQFVGLAMARYVVAIEPLASTPPEQVVRAITPVIDHYLTGDWAD